MQNEIENAECRIDNRVIFWVVFYFTPDLLRNVRNFSWTVGQLDKEFNSRSYEFRQERPYGSPVRQCWVKN